MDALMAKFAKFLVAAFMEWAGIKDLDDLLQRGAKAMHDELGDDLAKIDALPDKVSAIIAGQVSGLINQIAALPGQVVTAVRGLFPPIPGLFGR